MRVLFHLMPTEEMNDFFEVVKIDEGENQWTKEFEQLDVRPADELVDPGPRGRLDRTPAISEDGALIVINDDGDDGCDHDGNDESDSEDDRRGHGPPWAVAGWHNNISAKMNIQRI